MPRQTPLGDFEGVLLTYRWVSAIIRHKGTPVKARAVWSILRKGVRPNASDNDCHISYPWLHCDDSGQGQGKRKPPLWQVTVSFICKP